MPSVAWVQESDQSYSSIHHVGTLTVLQSLPYSAHLIHAVKPINGSHKQNSTAELTLTQNFNPFSKVDMKHAHAKREVIEPKMACARRTHDQREPFLRSSALQLSVIDSISSSPSDSLSLRKKPLWLNCWYLLISNRPLR